MEKAPQRKQRPGEAGKGIIAEGIAYAKAQRHGHAKHVGVRHGVSDILRRTTCWSKTCYSPCPLGHYCFFTGGKSKFSFFGVFGFKDVDPGDFLLFTRESGCRRGRVTTKRPPAGDTGGSRSGGSPSEPPLLMGRASAGSERGGASMPQLRPAGALLPCQRMATSRSGNGLLAGLLPGRLLGVRSGLGEVSRAPLPTHPAVTIVLSGSCPVTVYVGTGSLIFSLVFFLT